MFKFIKNKFFFIIALSVITLILLVVGAIALYKDEKSNMMMLFEEMNVSFLFMASFLSSMVFVLGNSFVSAVWLGEKYLLNNLNIVSNALTKFQDKFNIYTYTFAKNSNNYYFKSITK